MATRTILGNKPQDGEAFRYRATFLQEDKVTPVDLTSANTTVSLVYYRTDTNVSINSRGTTATPQVVINAGVGQNQHTGTAAGVLTFKAVPADTTLGGSANVTVVARYIVSYQDADTDTRTGIHEVQFEVEPLQTVS